jgi:hypothetical protein
VITVGSLITEVGRVIAHPPDVRDHVFSMITGVASVISRSNYRDHEISVITEDFDVP